MLTRRPYQARSQADSAGSIPVTRSHREQRTSQVKGRHLQSGGPSLGDREPPWAVNGPSAGRHRDAGRTGTVTRGVRHSLFARITPAPADPGNAFRTT